MSLSPGEKFKNYIGKKVGKLTPLHISPRPTTTKDEHVHWLCQCDCGKQKIISSSYLSRKNNKEKSCGCSSKHSIKRKTNIRDLSGLRFEKLLVLKRGEKPQGTQTREAYWECLCDCGKIKTIRASSLFWGKTKSCGCLVKEINSRPKCVGGSLARLASIYRRAARVRSLEFHLSQEEFKTLTKGKCYYCGCLPAKELTYRKDTIFYNGIDRVNNDKGYFLDNCVSCCEHCNKAKRMMSKKEFQNWIISVYNYFAKEKG